MAQFKLAITSIEQCCSLWGLSNNNPYGTICLSTEMSLAPLITDPIAFTQTITTRLFPSDSCIHSAFLSRRLRCAIPVT